MLYLCSVLFALGFLAYVAAVFFIGDDTGETLSDIGNAVMLTTAVLLLLRISWKGKPRKVSESGPEAEPSKPGWKA